MRKLIIWKKCLDLTKALAKDFMRLVMFPIGPCKSIKARKKKYSTRQPSWPKGEQTSRFVAKNLIKISSFDEIASIFYYLYLSDESHFLFSYFHKSLIFLFSTALKTMTRVKYIAKGLRATIGKTTLYWLEGKNGLH